MKHLLESHGVFAGVDFRLVATFRLIPRPPSRFADGPIVLDEREA